MLNTSLAFDPNYGICWVFYSESLGGWRQILSDGIHVPVTEVELKRFRIFPLRSAFWISERNLVDILLQQLDLSGVEDVYSETLTAVQTIHAALNRTRELEPVRIGLTINRQNDSIILRIGRLDVDDEMINVVCMNFVNVQSLEYSLKTLVKALAAVPINYNFKQLSGKEIFDIKYL